MLPVAGKSRASRNLWWFRRQVAGKRATRGLATASFCRGVGTICGYKPANVLSEARHGRRKAVFFFRSKLTLPGG